MRPAPFSYSARIVSMRILLTGAGGFVGSHVLRHLLQNTDWDIVCPVTFRHKGLPLRIQSACQGRNPLEAHEYRQRTHVLMTDLTAPVDDMTAHKFGEIDVIMNVASESHVDRSITEPGPFIRNNMDLMVSLLEYARLTKPKLFLQMSTDEVYGPAGPGQSHKEWDALVPSNPYSASKAAQEAICMAYWRTYGVRVVLTNAMNIIGEMQDSEKFVPKVMKHARAGIPMPIHVGSDGKPGSRFYLHARNLADSWLWLTERYVAKPDGTRGAFNIPMFDDGYDRPDRWHVVGEREIDNITMAQTVADMMGEPIQLEAVQFHQSRPGHDLRYALDGSKLADAGWKPPFSLEESLLKTVQWTLAHPEWLR